MFCIYIYTDTVPTHMHLPSCGPPWALMGWALMSPMGPSWPGPDDGHPSQSNVRFCDEPARPFDHSYVAQSYIYACTYMYIYICTGIYTCTCICLYIHIYISICM